MQTREEGGNSYYMEIRDLSLKVNTEEGVIQYMTENINGELQAIIIRSNEKVSVLIESELGYLIAEQRECYGDIYIPIRIREIDPKAQGFMNGAKFSINERLIIQVAGPKNTEVQLILRFE